MAKVCMACTCPCEVHKVHTHDSAKSATCANCDHVHKADGSCDCGCK